MRSRYTKKRLNGKLHEVWDKEKKLWFTWAITNLSHGDLMKLPSVSPPEYDHRNIVKENIAEKGNYGTHPLDYGDD